MAKQESINRISAPFNVFQTNSYRSKSNFKIRQDSLLRKYDQRLNIDKKKKSATFGGTMSSIDSSTPLSYHIATKKSFSYQSENKNLVN